MTALARVVEVAGTSHGASQVPLSLLPAGFTAWPAEDDVIALANVRGFMRRSSTGKEEEVRPFTREEQKVLDWWRTSLYTRDPITKETEISVTGPKETRPLRGIPQVRVSQHEDGTVFRGSLPFGRVEKRAGLWYAVHSDGTDSGGKISRDMAVHALVNYHNKMASQPRADPRRIEELEREVRESDPLHQFAKQQFRESLKGIVPEGVDPDAYARGLQEDILESDWEGAGSYAYDKLQKLRAAGWKPPDERKVGLASVTVKPFERVVRGRMEEVRQHTEFRQGHPDEIGGHRVQAVYTHPAVKRNLYDLGNGLHAEGKPGGKPGAVMRSPTGLQRQAMASKGWTHEAAGAARDAKGRTAGEEKWLANRQNWKSPAKTGVPGEAGPLAKTLKAAGAAKRAQRKPMPWARKPGGVLAYKDSLGIDRLKMPQLSGKNAAGDYVPSSKVVPKFVEAMKAKGVKVEREVVPPWSLRPSQTTGDAKAVRGIADGLKSGDLQDSKSIIISSDNRVLDGHHNWAGRMLADSEGGASGQPPGMRVIRIGLPADKALAAIRDFQQSQGIQSRGAGEMANPKYAQPGKPDALKKALQKVSAAGQGKMSDAEYAAHRQRLEDAIAKGVSAGLETHKTETLDGEGNFWKPERAAVHDEIIKSLLEKYKDVPSEGHAIIAGGLGGAGKSWTLRKDPEVAAGHFATVNPDDIKEELAKRGLVPVLPGMPEASPMERATSLAHEEASHIAKQLARQLQAKRKNMIWDITMSSPGGVESRVRDLRNAGYTHIHGMFVHIPLEKSVESAANRHREGLEAYRAGKSALGERYVPAGIIRASARVSGTNANRQTFEDLKPKFDSWALFSRDDMKDAKLVASGGEPRK